MKTYHFCFSQPPLLYITDKQTMKSQPHYENDNYNSNG